MQMSAIHPNIGVRMNASTPHTSFYGFGIPSFRASRVPLQVLLLKSSGCPADILGEPPSISMSTRPSLVESLIRPVAIRTHDVLHRRPLARLKSMIYPPCRDWFSTVRARSDVGWPEQGAVANVHRARAHTMKLKTSIGSQCLLIPC